MMSSMQQQQGHEEEESHGGGFSSGSSSIGGGAIGVRKGSWTEEEDILLRLCVEKFGEGNWRQVPRRAGLNRCRKSCRLRWLNYLRPNINRSRFAHDEVDLIIRLHKLLGNKWSLISRRLPGRTANDVKNYWNSHLRKPSSSASSPSPQNSAVQNKEVVTTSTAKPVHNNNNPSHEVIKPQPRTLKKSWTWSARRPVDSKEEKNVHEPRMETAEDWWKQFLMHDDDDDDMDSFFSNIWGNGFASGLSSSSPDQSVPDPWVQQPPAEGGVVGKCSTTAVESMMMEDMDPFCMVPDDFCLDNNFWNTVID